MTPYSYIYFDEALVPYYVGEGSKSRWLTTNHDVQVPTPENILRFYHNTKKEAQEHEVFLITHIGRRDIINACGHLGPLLNNTDGGAGCTNCPQQKRAAAITGTIYPPVATPETRAKGGKTNVASGHLKRISAAAGRISGAVNGLVQGRRNVESGLVFKAAHTRWHVNRGIVSVSCTLCQAVQQ